MLHLQRLPVHSSCSLFCKHAFHYRCFEEHNSDQPDQCPLCVTTNNPKVPDMDSTAKLLSHHSFCDELDSCTDPISFISQYISNGVFDRVKDNNTNK
uniref:RING-type domain-containing protein n=1 Tax=Ditylenchus dipsaci TaxID=166011 RepID=A0A915DUE5_9BILA